MNADRLFSPFIHIGALCSILRALLVSSDANSPHSVVYQNEEGQWVTDLAYYSSFEKEVDWKMPENDDQFKPEDFVPASMYQAYNNAQQCFCFFNVTM